MSILIFPEYIFLPIKKEASLREQLPEFIEKMKKKITKERSIGTRPIPLAKKLKH